MMKVLVAHDGPAVLKSISVYIRGMGYEVFEADNGWRAIQILEEGVDILLTDIGMSTMKGDKLIGWTKKNKLSTKTILMSAHPRVKQFAAKCGADAYIEKGLGFTFRCSFCQRQKELFNL